MPKRLSIEIDPKWFIPAVILYLLLIMSIFAHAQEYVNMDIVIEIESNWRESAVNRHSKATGLGQITPIALKDFNYYNGTSYALCDMKDAQRNMRVSYWFLNDRIPQMLKHYGLPINTKTILWAYNAGIGRVRQGIMPKETIYYIIKYNTLIKEVR